MKGSAIKLNHIIEKIPWCCVVPFGSKIPLSEVFLVARWCRGKFDQNTTINSPTIVAGYASYDQTKDLFVNASVFYQPSHNVYLTYSHLWASQNFIEEHLTFNYFAYLDLGLAYIPQSAPLTFGRIL